MTATIRQGVMAAIPATALAKTVLTEIGPVQIEVPRDRDANFSPMIVRKRQRRLDGIDEIVLSLTADGLTTREVAAHFDEVYGAKVSEDTISRITDEVLEEMGEWANRPSPAVSSRAMETSHHNVRLTVPRTLPGRVV
jgi:transposase-like protein